MKNPYLPIVFIRHLGWGIVIPVAVIWQLQRGLNLAQVGTVAAVFLIVQMIAELPTGLFADKIGRTKSIILGGSIHILSLTLFALGTNFWFFLVATVFEGLGWALISGADEAYLYDFVQNIESRDGFRKLISRVSLMDETGTFLGFLASAILIRYLSISTSLYFAVSLILIAAILSLILLREPAKEKNESIQHDISSSEISRGLKFILSHRIFLFLALAFAFLYESGRFLWQPQLLHNGMHPEQISLTYAGMALFSIAGAYVAGHHFLKSTIQTLISLAVVQALLFFFFSLDALWLGIIALTLYLFIEKISRVIQSDVINARLKGETRATFLSMRNLARNGTGAAYAWVAGALAVTSLHNAFYLLIALTLVSMIVMLGVCIYEGSLRQAHSTQSSPQ